MPPFPYAYETINLPTLPPVPPFLAFAVQCIDNPFFFLQVCLCADFACARGLLLSTKLTPSIKKVISSFQNESRSFFLLFLQIAISPGNPLLYAVPFSFTESTHINFLSRHICLTLLLLTFFKPAASCR